MGFKLIDTSRVTITRQLAITFRDMASVDGERSLKPSRISLLSSEIASGQLTAFRWAKAVVGGQEIRVNGRTSSYILSAWPDPFPVAQAVLETYLCDTVNDVHVLWTKFDSNFSSRTALENRSSLAKKEACFEGMEQRVLGLVESAVCQSIYGHRFGTCTTASTRFAHLLENKRFVLWASEILTSRNRSLRRAGVVLAMLMSFNKDHHAATEFWNLVASGESPNPDCPSRRLQLALAEHSSDFGTGSRTGKKTLKFEQFYSLSLHAWNLWRSGLTAKVLRMPKSPPEAL